MNRKYVAISIQDDSGPIFCLGIFGNYYEAFGTIMDRIYEFKESYKDDGDEFAISDPYETDFGGGVGIDVKYKASCCEKSNHNFYYVLYYDEVKDD